MANGLTVFEMIRVLEALKYKGFGDCVVLWEQRNGEKEPVTCEGGFLHNIIDKESKPAKLCKASERKRAFVKLRGFNSNELSGRLTDEITSKPNIASIRSVVASLKDSTSGSGEVRSGQLAKDSGTGAPGSQLPAPNKV